MPKRKYNQEQIEYIREIAPGRYNYDITKLFNQRFNTDITEGQLKSLKSNNKIRSNLKRKRRTPNEKLFTEEQFQFIKENAEGISNQELTDRVNQTFNLSITGKQMSAWKKNWGIVSGLTGFFEKGHVPDNKGKKQSEYLTAEQIERTKATRFQNGHIPKNYTPIGTERLSSDGYMRIKVQDHGEWHHRWQLKHKIIWEKENGPIPEDKVLTFLDGDPLNITTDNLTLITRAEHIEMTRRKLRFDNPEMTKLGAAIAKVNVKTSDVIKKRKELKNEQTN